MARNSPTVDKLYDRFERLGMEQYGWRWRGRSWGYQVHRCMRWKDVPRWYERLRGGTWELCNTHVRIPRKRESC